MAVARRSLVELNVVPNNHRDGADVQRQIAYSTTADRVWVLSSSDESIVVLDGTTGEAAGPIATRSAPQTCVFDNSAGLA